MVLHATSSTRQNLEALGSQTDTSAFRRSSGCRTDCQEPRNDARSFSRIVNPYWQLRFQIGLGGLRPIVALASGGIDIDRTLLSDLFESNFASSLPI